MMSTPNNPADMVQDDGVHRSIYTDDTVFQQEMEKIFRTTWVYVAHESQLPEPGDYFTTELGQDPVIVSRDEDGELHVLTNRCLHRGATVCQSEKGNSNYFRCPYHGWTYRNNGKLTGVPYPKAYGDDFDKESLGLYEAPRVDVYRGFIFASLSYEGPSLLEHLSKAASYIDLYVDGTPDQTREIEACRGKYRYVYRANWKFQLENAVDGYHPGFVHKSYYEAIENKSGNKMRVFDDTRSAATAMDLGNGHAILDQRSELGDTYYQRVKSSPGGPEMIAELEREHGEERARTLINGIVGGNGVNLAIFPNLMLLLNQIRIIKPVAVNRTRVDVYPTTIKGVPEGLNQLRLRGYEGFFGPAGFGAPDDLEMFHRAYEGLEAKSVEWLLLSRGLWREQALPDGTIEGKISDETTQRAQYSRWRELMAVPSPTSEPELDISEDRS